MKWRSDLITLAEAYCAATGKSESRVGALVGGTGIFYRRLRAQRDCSATVYESALQWFSNEWPEDLLWPEGIERPERGRPVLTLKELRAAATAEVENSEGNSVREDAA